MKPQINSRITVEVQALLTEEEVRALDALVGYGIEPFLKVFYEKLGEAYMRPHEKGLRSLFETINKKIIPELLHIDAAREYLSRRDHYELARRQMADRECQRSVGDGGRTV